MLKWNNPHKKIKVLVEQISSKWRISSKGNILYAIFRPRGLSPFKIGIDFRLPSITYKSAKVVE